MDALLNRRKNARLAGLLYLVVGLLGFYGLMYVSSKTIVKNDPAATLRNILQNEALYRSGIGVHIICAAIFLLLAFVFYQLFIDVSSFYTRLLVALIVVQVPIVFVIESFKLSAVTIIKEQGIENLISSSATSLSNLLIKMHGSGVVVLELFWGLWLLPLGILMRRSVFMPSLLGLLLLLAGIGYSIDSLVTITIPSLHYITQKIALGLSMVAELSAIAWLLIKGVKNNQS